MFDAVYTPRETRLLRDALASGCLVADGVAMFVGQAVEQLKLFTGGLYFVHMMLELSGVIVSLSCSTLQFGSALWRSTVQYSTAWYMRSSGKLQREGVGVRM